MKFFKDEWAIIFGGTGGFGYASSKYLAERGMNIFILHRDNRALADTIKSMKDELLSFGVKVCFMNTNACEETNFEKIIHVLKQEIDSTERVRLFLHAIADGNINEIIDVDNWENQLSNNDFQHTINTMGLNFLEWSKKLIQHGFLKSSSRIIGLTSEGSKNVLSGYAAVACAKATLESSCKYLAVKLASQKITVNLINAGITDTRALSKFSNYDLLIESAKKRNPSGRLTQPEDIAKVVFLMCLEESSWITGEIIRVDGGEQLLSV